jgi:hypothetical protein
MNLLQPSICAHRLKSGATQTKLPIALALRVAHHAGFNHNFLLVRVGGFGLYSREFIRQVFLPEVYYLEGVQ